MESVKRKATNKFILLEKVRSNCIGDFDESLQIAGVRRTLCDDIYGRAHHANFAEQLSVVWCAVRYKQMRTKIDNCGSRAKLSALVVAHRMQSIEVRLASAGASFKFSDKASRHPLRQRY
jgi:hypothetical protein